MNPCRRTQEVRGEDLGIPPAAWWCAHATLLAPRSRPRHANLCSQSDRITYGCAPCASQSTADYKAAVLPAKPEVHDKLSCLGFCVCIPCVGPCVFELSVAGASAENYVVMKKFQEVREKEKVDRALTQHAL